MKNKHKFSLLFTIVAFLTLFLTGCSNNSSSTAKKSSNNQITVNYTLKQGKKTVSDKSVKIPKKKIYWTYTINGKWTTKGADKQAVANKDKVKFTLDKVK